jgi:uncharacterized BrkB/YihY/UPF0761 family membrane protein
MSGEGVRRSIWIFIMPLMLLLGLVIIIIVSPIFSQVFSQINPDINFNFGGINEGIAQILPILGAGLGIAMLFLVFCIIKRGRR